MKLGGTNLGALEGQSAATYFDALVGGGISADGGTGGAGAIPGGIWLWVSKSSCSRRAIATSARKRREFWPVAEGGGPREEVP